MLSRNNDVKNVILTYGTFSGVVPSHNLIPKHGIIYFEWKIPSILSKHGRKRKKQHKQYNCIY